MKRYIIKNGCDIQLSTYISNYISTLFQGIS